MRSPLLCVMALMTGLVGCGTAAPTAADTADAGNAPADASGDTADARPSGGAVSVRAVGDAFRVALGGTVMIPVTVTRTGGAGEVEVSLMSAPAGVSAARLVIPASMTSGMLAVSASEAAAPGGVSITIRGASSGATGDASVPLTVTGRPGTPDLSLRGTGVAIDATGPAGWVADAALLADGKVLVLFNRADTMALELRRYDANGALDASFGANGVSPVSAAPMLTAWQAAIVVRDDGTALVAYTAGDSGAVTAFEANGARLRGYGDANETQTLSASDLRGAAHRAFVARQGAHAYAVVWAGMDTRVYRLTAGGAIDPTWAQGGVAIVAGLGTVDVKFDAMGRMVLAGYIREDSAIVRLTPDGALDPSFAGDGSTIHGAGGPDFYSSVQPMADGRIAAFVELGSNTLRVHAEASGALDPSFSMDGVQAFQLGSYPHVVELNRDLVVVGQTNGGYDILRLSATDGALRTDFDGDGIARINVATGRTLSTAATRFDALGRLTVVGISTADNFSPGQVVIMRAWM